MKNSLVVVILALLLGVGAVLLWSPETPVPTGMPAARHLVSLVDAPEREEGGFARTSETWRATFPGDHGPHLGHRSESWQFTGQVTAQDGRDLGFRLDFFRLGLLRNVPQRESAWATQHVYWAQLAVTDIRDKRFRFFERYSRDALALAGAGGSPPRIWVEDWQVALPVEAADRGGFRVEAAEGDIAMNLSLEPVKAAVPLSGQGPFGDGDGSPFHAYWLGRMSVEGTLTAGGKKYLVRGRASLEHAWGELPLPLGQVVWNRFKLQLGDGTEVAVLRLRRRDGKRAASASGLLVSPSGETRRLASGDLTLEAIGEWVSPLDGTAYPSRWRLRVPDAAMVLDIRAAVSDQEVHASMRYWAGHVQVMGSRNGQSVDGRGHVQLFGYAAGVD